MSFSSIGTEMTSTEKQLADQTVVTIQSYWDVVAPAPKNSVKGQIVKGMFKNIGKKRRISLEIHHIPVATVKKIDRTDSKQCLRATISGGSFVEKVFVRISKRKKYHAATSPRHDSVSISSEANKSKSVEKNEEYDLRITNNGGGFDIDDDDDSSIGSGMSGISSSNQTVISFPDDLHPMTSPLSAIRETDVAEEQEIEPMEQGREHRQGLASSIANKEKWVTKYKIDVTKLSIQKTESNKVTLHLHNSHDQTSGNTVNLPTTQQRTIHFYSTEQANDFCNELVALKKKEKEATARNMERATSGLDIGSKDIDDKLEFLIEIVGAQNLAIADISSSDPFVVAKFGNREIHKTKYISNNLNPIYTLRKRSLFIFETTYKELFTDPEGMTFIVKDYDLNRDDILGAVSLPSKTLYLANEERIEMDLHPLIIGGKRYPKKNDKLGSLAIRCRRATDNDKKFMIKLKEDFKAKKLTSTFDKMNKIADMKTKPTLVKTVLATNMKTIKAENGEKIQKFRLRPDVDPKRADVEWMTAAEIDKEVMKPSTSSKSLGIGDIAKIYLEILQCDNLPNLESIKLFGNKTDAFVQVVYEDCVSETCIIDDCDSPRWMPWSNRAFTLHTKYPSSVIYLGVHDYDAGSSLFTSHDLVGRCAINVAHLRPDTEYVLDYALHNTAMKLERKKHGSIKVRLRIEIDDPRAYLLASFKIPPAVYVNTKSVKNFHCMRGTIHGDFDITEYSLQTTILLFREILQQKRVIYYAKDIVFSILFWRATTKFKPLIPWFMTSSQDANNFDMDTDLTLKPWMKKYMRRKDICVPLNSLTIFLAAVLVVERPHLFPSVSFFTMGWLLIATKTFKQEYPNPWWRSTSFSEMFLMLSGKASRSPETIAVGENSKEAEERDKYWEELIQTEEEIALKNRMEIAEEQQALERDLLEAKGNADDISTKVANITVDPFFVVKPYIFPIQQTLLHICYTIRFIKNVLLWEESHYSFFFTLASFSLAALFLLLPWVFIFRWSARILVWGLLGPWMRFLDPTTKLTSNEERFLQVAKSRMKRKMHRDTTLNQARILNENARKYRDFKMYFFGKFLTKVPIIQVDRYLDLPLSSSSAVPAKKKEMKLGELAIEEAADENYEVGQQLVGKMIPKIRRIPKTSAPRGQPAKRKSLIKNGELGADVGDDLALVAYIRIGSMAVTACFVSYLVVPLIVQSLSILSSSWQ